MVMKIENYEVTADTFNFPHNSKVFDDANTFDLKVTEVPFDDKHIMISKGSLRPKVLSIQGFFEGANKDTNYQSLLEHTASNELKKFYFDTDKFYIVMSQQFKKTQTGGRTNFLDYVGSMITPIPFIFSDTQKTDTYNGSWATGTGTNAGTHKTFIEEIVVTFSGAGTDKTFSVQDSYNGGITISGLTYAASDILTIKLITMVDSNGYNTTEYWYATFYDDSAGTTTQVQRSIATGKFELNLILEPTDAINSLSFTDTDLVSYSAVFKWRDSDLS